MTAPIVGLRTLAPPIGPVKKKRVLLVDASSAKREMRAETMRKLGMDVDTAADFDEARSWWRADLYNLVLINMENEMGHRDRFCEDIRGATPPQQLAFLVGKPEYLSDFPNADGAGVELIGGTVISDDAPAMLSADASGGTPLRWGIMEASRRISAARSLAVAKTRAVRERPSPPRDLETRHPKRSSAWSQVLPELQKEELQ